MGGHSGSFFFFFLNKHNIINVCSCTELFDTLPYRSSLQHCLASYFYHFSFISHPSLAFIHRIQVKQNSNLWWFLKHSAEEQNNNYCKMNLLCSANVRLQYIFFIVIKQHGLIGSDIIKMVCFLEKLNQNPMSTAEIDWWANFNWLLKRNYKLGTVVLKSHWKSTWGTMQCQFLRLLHHHSAGYDQKGKG